MGVRPSMGTVGDAYDNAMSEDIDIKVILEPTEKPVENGATRPHAAKGAA